MKSRSHSKVRKPAEKAKQLQSLQIMTTNQFVQYKLPIEIFSELKDSANQTTNQW